MNHAHDLANRRVTGLLSQLSRGQFGRSILVHLTPRHTM